MWTHTLSTHTHTHTHPFLPHTPTHHTHRCSCNTGATEGVDDAGGYGEAKRILGQHHASLDRGDATLPHHPGFVGEHTTIYQSVYNKVSSLEILLYSNVFSLLLVANWWQYSRTSHNGPSEKRTTSLQRTKAVLRIEITIVLIHK